MVDRGTERPLVVVDGGFQVAHRNGDVVDLGQEHERQSRISFAERGSAMATPSPTLGGRSLRRHYVDPVSRIADEDAKLTPPPDPVISTADLRQ
jgi:hypothetical protein